MLRCAKIFSVLVSYARAKNADLTFCRILLPWRPRVLRPCDMEYVMLHLIFSLPHA